MLASDTDLLVGPGHIAWDGPGHYAARSAYHQQSFKPYPQSHFAPSFASDHRASAPRQHHSPYETEIYPADVQSQRLSAFGPLPAYAVPRAPASAQDLAFHLSRVRPHHSGGPEQQPVQSRYYAAAEASSPQSERVALHSAYSTHLPPHMVAAGGHQWVLPAGWLPYHCRLAPFEDRHFERPSATGLSVPLRGYPVSEHSPALSSSQDSHFSLKAYPHRQVPFSTCNTYTIARFLHTPIQNEQVAHTWSLKVMQKRCLCSNVKLRSLP